MNFVNFQQNNHKFTKPIEHSGNQPHTHKNSIKKVSIKSKKRNKPQENMVNCHPAIEKNLSFVKFQKKEKKKKNAQLYNQLKKIKHFRNQLREKKNILTRCKKYKF